MSRTKPTYWHLSQMSKSDLLGLTAPLQEELVGRAERNDNATTSTYRGIAT